MKMKRHFVTFFSPGTFVAETTTKPIKSWDVATARRMAASIEERYGATPYGFQFSTRARSGKDLDSKIIKDSPMYYINCKVETIEDVAACKDPKEDILLSNMRCNKWKKIVTTIKGWRWTQPLDDKDIVLP